jgi:hypothetical protein
MKKAPGILPSPGWLQTNGYSGLAAIMRLYPKAFAHIRQDRKHRTATERVVEAERLAKKHGKLPNPKWLEANGYNALNQARRLHPDLFVHIQQSSKRGKRPEEWVVEAERLAKKYGKLPHPGWLEENGYNGLSQVIRKHPKQFAHIRQESKRGKRPEQWVAEAEKLAKKYGKLPHPKWLQTNGYAGLDEARRKHPKLFAHIHQTHKAGRRQDEWIAVAERLARKKGGTLPHYQWLMDNGYRGLAHAIQSHRCSFAHIPQDRLKKSKPLAAYVQDAERLARKHKSLPKGNWLFHHGYGNLDNLRRRHPEAFAHIPQDKWNPKSLVDYIQEAQSLAAKYGKLPGSQWLTTHGYGTLCNVMGRNQAAFAHIPREQLHKPLAYHVQEAKRLAKQYGKLPNACWLVANGFAALNGAIQKHRDAFKGIPQLRLKSGPKAK